jgi:hypothetical protein
MVKKIKLNKNKFTLVDDNVYDYLNQWKWTIHWNKGTKTYYAVRTTGTHETSDKKRKMIYMHREIMNSSKNLHIDHINHDTLDNRRSNLRYVTPRQNHQNRITKYSSKYPGVSFYKSHNKWVARISINGKNKFLGLYETEEEAYEAYKNECSKLEEPSLI